MTALCEVFNLFEIAYCLIRSQFRSFPASRYGFSARICGTGLAHLIHTYLHGRCFPAFLAPGCCGNAIIQVCSHPALPSCLFPIHSLHIPQIVIEQSSEDVTEQQEQPLQKGQCGAITSGCASRDTVGRMGHTCTHRSWATVVVVVGF